MSPIKREFILYLEDMFQSILRIEEYLGDLDLEKTDILTTPDRF